MERVQFQQEQMLAELKDLVDKGLFTQKEVKQIIKRRTVLETALVRRVPKKADFLRYIAYEMGLEQLRRKRVDRLKVKIEGQSISDYALVRRQFHVFERALKKFKSDVGLWIQYVNVAKKEGARSLVGRICARALQLHPNVPSLYILAAQHELKHLSPSAARILLQRGLRLNPDSVELWREYVKMELGFVENLRRRWSVLGINVDEEKARASKGKEKEHLDGAAMDEDGGLEVREREKMEDEANAEGDAGEEARRAIMRGTIVKSVISSAAKSLPRVKLFMALQSLLQTYPLLPTLRAPLLSHLHELLKQTLPRDPAAIRLHATRHLTLELQGAELVERLREANEELVAAVKDLFKAAQMWAQGRDEEAESLRRMYAQFVEEWAISDALDANLRLYLISSLRLVIQSLPAPRPSPSLCATHLRLLLSPRHPEPRPGGEKVLRLARRYTQARAGGPAVANVWLARLDAEVRFGSPGDAERAWEEARTALVGVPTAVAAPCVSLAPADSLAGHVGLALDVDAAGGEPQPEWDQGGKDEVMKVWTWGLGKLDLLCPDATTEADRKIRLKTYYERLLSESMRCAPASTAPLASSAEGEGWSVHERLLVDYATLRGTRDGALECVRTVRAKYLPSARVWAAVFALLAFPSASPEMERALRAAHEAWRLAPGGAAAAALALARWLLGQGRGVEAREAVVRVAGAGGGLAEGERASLERAWAAVLGEAAGEKEHNGNEGEEEGDGVMEI